MAQVTRDTAQQIDLLLNVLVDTWQELPSVARDIESWHPLDQSSYVENWTPNDQLLMRLQQAAADGQMTPEQQTRYRTLLALVERNRPYLDQILR